MFELIGISYSCSRLNIIITNVLSVSLFSSVILQCIRCSCISKVSFLSTLGGSAGVFLFVVYSINMSLMFRCTISIIMIIVSGCCEVF